MLNELYTHFISISRCRAEDDFRLYVEKKNGLRQQRRCNICIIITFNLWILFLINIIDSRSHLNWWIVRYVFSFTWVRSYDAHRIHLLPSCVMVFGVRVRLFPFLHNCWQRIYDVLVLNPLARVHVLFSFRFFFLTSFKIRKHWYRLTFIWMPK